MEKGALGLFFEMNHFVGIGLMFYIFWFVIFLEKPTGLDADDTALYNKMYNWIYFQYIWGYVCIVLSTIVYFLYSSMNKRAQKLDKGPKKQSSGGDVENR